MSILNSLPTGIGIATETSNGLMSFEDKKSVNKINRMEADISTKMNRDEKIKSSQLDTSNNAVKIQPQNLSEEVKQMMTGETPISPNLKHKSLITEYYADNSVTSDKRTAVGSIAIIVSEDYCNFNTIGDNDVALSIPKDYIIYFGSDMKVVTNIPETIILPKGESSVITYSKLYGISASNELYEDDFIIGAFDGTDVTMFNGKYTVDGSIISGEQILNGSSIKDFSLDARKLAIQHGQIISNKDMGPYLNANFTSNFIEVVKDFDMNIADQYTISIKVDSDNARIPENTFNEKYLYIYYDLGIGALSAIWSSSDTTKSILNNNEKLVLLGIISDNKTTVGLNTDFISVNSISLKNRNIEYADIFNGKIIIDFKNKIITATELWTFIDNNVITLIEDNKQNITLTDDIITNIIDFGVPYTLGAVRLDFNSTDYKLVFVKTEDIANMGLDAIPLTTIKKYNVSNNIDKITVINTNGNTIKSSSIISQGYTLPIDNTTIVAKLATEIIDGNLHLTTTTVPGTTIVDPFSNTEYKITEELKYQTIVENLHGLYSVLFNTETGRIETVISSYNIDPSKYISLGSVFELNDSLAYTSYGPIVDHITLNSNRPANYAIVDGPDPDKGYDWSNNRLVLPKDIYLLANSQYTLYCQNMSMNKYIDNDYILYEIGLPHSSVLTENVLNINSPVTGDFESRIVGKFKGNNNCIYKDINIHFEKPEGKELSILCIGDDTVDMNMPSYIKNYLEQLGYTPTMLGKTKNVINANGYGMKNLSEEFGEGHKGWRMTDFMCKTIHKDGSPYYIANNPFMNQSKFDFSYYMTTNSYEKVDVIIISVGLNDITGYHTASAIEDIENLTIYQNIEQLPNMYKEMIASIQAFDPSIKIIINPTMINGMDDDFNRKSLLLTETLLYDLKDVQNVFFVPGYITQPIFVSANRIDTKNYEQYNDINDTKIGSSISSSEINGIGQSNLAYLITSTIIGITK